MKSEKLTYVATKKELFRLYHKLPDDFLRETINDIIAKSRGLNIDEVKFVKTITPAEFRLFVCEIGEV